MKVYIVTEFKKDKETGYTLPSKMTVFKTSDLAEDYAFSVRGCIPIVCEREVLEEIGD